MARRNLANKRILITGASSGIGRGLVIEAALRGAQVLATARNAERLAETANLAGNGVATVVADLTIPEDRQRVIAEMERRFGGMDALVNNAGIGATGHFQYARPDRLRTIFETNFFAPVELCRLAIPMLKVGNDPAILMINSVAGRRAIPSRSEYSASKFALMGFSEALRAELSKDNVAVSVVSPGLTESNFEQNMIENTARHSLHSQRSMTAAQAAKLIFDAFERRKNEVTLTFKSKLLVFLNRLAPRFIDRKMEAFVRKLYKNDDKAPQQTTPAALTKEPVAK